MSTARDQPALQFDYTSYSDASTPRTPSPRTSICSDGSDLHPPYHSPHINYKPQLDAVTIARPHSIFDHPHHSDDPAAHGIVPESHALEGAHMWSQPAYPYNPPGSRGSLLEELYDHDIPDHSSPHHHASSSSSYHNSPDPAYHGHTASAWSNIPQTAHGEHIHQHSMRHAHDVAMTRRATFPYVRHDRPEQMSPYPPPHSFMSHNGDDSLHSSPYNSRPGTVYGEPLSLEGSPHLGGLHHLDEPFAHTVPMNGHPGMYDGHIKTEDGPIIVPSQTAYCRPPSAGMHPLSCLAPHNGLMVQYTDDAASKETQHLRRRCFNCHTTEPPSWRRSTLNPGKIVCNKCGLYERTHLRPRPLRFDELRAGSKTRKQPKVGSGSPKEGGKAPNGGIIKKERDTSEEITGPGMIQRRSSVSSTSSSLSSGGNGATSDWDDNVSVYSSGSLPHSGPPSSFNSPSVQAFNIPLAHDGISSNNSSPPPTALGGIRLPNAPFTDIASLTQSPPSMHASPAMMHQSPAMLHSSPGMMHASPMMNSNILASSPTPRKAATAPTPFYHHQAGSAASLHASPQMQAQGLAMEGLSGGASEAWMGVGETKPVIRPRSDSLVVPSA